MGPKMRPPVVVEHADLPELVGHALHEIFGLVEPQELSRDGEAGLVLGRIERGSKVCASAGRPVMISGPANMAWPAGIGRD